MKLRNFYICIISFLMSVLFVGCVDEPLVDAPALGDGSATLSATVSFFPHAEVLGSRGTPGNAIKDIESLSVIVYDQYQALYRIYNEIPFKLETHRETPSMPDSERNDYGSEWSSTGKDAEGNPIIEESARATFTLPGKLPVGRYYMYCVANLGRDITEKDAESVQTLQSIVLEWNPDAIEANNQMFGYFTTEENAKTDKPLAGFDANAIDITGNNNKVHAWIKRAASKVTVAYDPSGLKQDVFIYIHKVTIKDIPRTCYLGKNNKPGEDFEGDKPTEKDIEKYLIPEGECISYRTEPAGETVENSDKTGLLLNNGSGVKGSDHTPSADALFFYENVQGDFKGEPNKEDYNKEPKLKDVKAFLEALGKGEEVSPKDFDTKDQVPFGSYIEVEGYYISRNPENVGSGKIKYRFMLGKNTTYNFNAQRNHHYKLTLQFKGWANQPEWHIEYQEENPGIYLPDIFYMPYLYNQRAELPVKLNGKCKSLKFEIVENAWGPRDPKSPTSAPDETVKATGGASAGMSPTYYDFVWNRTAWGTYNGISWPCLGFLALTKPSDTPPANILSDVTYSDSISGYNQLKAYYEGKGGSPQFQNTISQKVRELKIFTSGEHDTGDNISLNKYKVKGTTEGGTTDLLIPLFTRPKSMIHGTDYSGNNPYEYFVRYAKIHVTAIFETGAGDKEIKKDIDIYQVPRITNPKAVWRKSGSTESFDVLLTTRAGAPANSDFVGFLSDGSWTAEIEKTKGANNFSLQSNAGDDYYMSVRNDKIVGKTGSQIKFRINFGGTDACGIVTVRYNGGTCIHKIFLRQGYAPIQVGERSTRWCSYNLYSSTGKKNANGDNTTVVGTLVKSPLSIGTFFKKGNYQQGITAANNATWGALVNGPYAFKLSSGGDTKTWAEIDSVQSRRYRYNGTLYRPNITWKWAKFSIDGKKYRVPSYDDYLDITENCDFGFGVLYGDGASTTQTTALAAEGFEDMSGETVTSTQGVRGVIVYNKDADQIFFTMGKFGQGRRTSFNLQGQTHGVLRYGDVTNPLTSNTFNSRHNIFRPIPYNLGHQPGSVYWISQVKVRNQSDVGQDVGAWDINFFSFNFSQYTNNCWRDALPIKLVLDE